MKLLYRAVCFCTDRYESCEKLVFFDIDAASHQSPAEHLRKLLTAVWGVPASAIDYYNLSSETDLHRQSITSDDNGVPPAYHGPVFERQLFEIGCSLQGPIYPSLNDWPLMLVSPRNHRRLVSAFMDCHPALEAAHG
ncbi:hypothetical protein [Musicola keenii]|uniref:hypothetical protein n=1 Tax=Musicola keenii TaxID=2884250 RepID=UPI001782CEA5|nr:hypothetical protein [Musicola keenii]